MLVHETATQEPPIEFLYANIAAPPHIVLLGSLATYEAYTDDVGADGIELTPVRGRLMQSVLQRGHMLEGLANPAYTGAREGLYEDFIDRLHPEVDRRRDWTYEDEAIAKLIRAGHSGFRKETHDESYIIAKLFPTWRESLRQLQLVQRVTGLNTGNLLSAVLYAAPDDAELEDYSNENAPFGERLLQPKPTEWKKLRLEEDSPADEMEENLRAHGFTGVAFDGFHAQVEQHRLRFSSPLELALLLAAAGLTSEIHLSVNRTDIAPKHSQLANSTRQAKEAFVRSPEAAANTLEGAILLGIVREWKNNPIYRNRRKRIVLEENPRSVNKKQQRSIIENLRLLVENVKPEVLHGSQ
jgi:hypothetical protein